MLKGLQHVTSMILGNSGSNKQVTTSYQMKKQEQLIKGGNVERGDLQQQTYIGQ